MTRNYSKVPDEKRQLLIELINTNLTIKDAARSTDIKYENAKAIYRVYRKEQRTQKRRNRFRHKMPDTASNKQSIANAKLRQKAAAAKKIESEEDEEKSEDDSMEDEDMSDHNNSEHDARNPNHEPEKMMGVVDSKTKRGQNKKQINVPIATQKTESKKNQLLKQGSIKGAVAKLSGNVISIQSAITKKKNSKLSSSPLKRDTTAANAMMHQIPKGKQQPALSGTETNKKHNIFGEQPQIKTPGGANDKNFSNQPTPVFMEMMSQLGGAPATQKAHQAGKVTLNEEYANTYKNMKVNYQQQIEEYDYMIRTEYKKLVTTNDQPSKDIQPVQQKHQTLPSILNNNGTSLVNQLQQQQLQQQQTNATTGSQQKTNQNMAQTLNYIQVTDSSQIALQPTAVKQLQNNAPSIMINKNKSGISQNNVVQQLQQENTSLQHKMSSMHHSDNNQNAQLHHQSVLNKSSGTTLPFQLNQYQFGSGSSGVSRVTGNSCALPAVSIKLSQDMIDFRQTQPQASIELPKNSFNAAALHTTHSAGQHYPSQQAIHHLSVVPQQLTQFSDFPHARSVSGNQQALLHQVPQQLMGDQNMTNRLSPEMQAIGNQAHHQAQNQLNSNTANQQALQSVQTVMTATQQAQQVTAAQYASQQQQQLNPPQHTSLSGALVGGQGLQNNTTMATAHAQSLQQSQQQQQQSAAYLENLEEEKGSGAPIGNDLQKRSFSGNSIGLQYYLAQQSTSPIQQPMFQSGSQRVSGIFKMPEANQQFTQNPSTHSMKEVNPQVVDQITNGTANARSHNMSQQNQVQQQHQTPQRKNSSIQDSGNLSTMMNMAHQKLSGILPSDNSNFKVPEKRHSVLQNNQNFEYDNSSDQKQELRNTERNPAKQTLTGHIGYFDGTQARQKLSSTIPGHQNESLKQHTIQQAGKNSPFPGLANQMIENQSNLSQLNYKNVTNNQIAIQKSKVGKSSQIQIEPIQNSKITVMEIQQAQPNVGLPPDEGGIKSTLRLPYLGHNQLFEPKIQLSLRNVQDQSTPSQARGIFDKITSDQLDDPQKNKVEAHEVYSRSSNHSSKEGQLPNFALNSAGQQLGKISGDLTPVRVQSDKLEGQNNSVEVNLISSYPEHSQLYSGLNQNQMKGIQADNHLQNQKHPADAEIYKGQANDTNSALLRSDQPHRVSQDLNQTVLQKTSGLIVNQTSENSGQDQNNFTLVAMDLKNSLANTTTISQQNPASKKFSEAGGNQHQSMDTRGLEQSNNRKISDQRQEQMSDYGHSVSFNGVQVVPATTQIALLFAKDDMFMINQKSGSRQNGSNGTENFALGVDMDVKISEQDSSGSSYSAASDEHQVSKALTLAKVESTAQKANKICVTGAAQEGQEQQHHKDKKLMQPNTLMQQIMTGHPQVQQCAQPSHQDPRQPSLMATPASLTKVTSQANMASNVINLKPQLQQNVYQQAQQHLQHQHSQQQQQIDDAMRHQQQVAATLPAPLVNLSSTSLPSQGILQQPSEVTRYLLNQLEQMHIKLKTLGYCKNDIRGKQQQVIDPNSQQQAFITIDNFSSEVLALHNQLSTQVQTGQQSVQQTVELNFRMLHSLTSVVQLMWNQLENSKTSVDWHMSKASAQMLAVENQSQIGANTRMSATMLTPMAVLNQRVSENVLGGAAQGVQQPNMAISVAAMRANEMQQAFSKQQQQQQQQQQAQQMAISHTLNNKNIHQQQVLPGQQLNNYELSTLNSKHQETVQQQLHDAALRAIAHQPGSQQYMLSPVQNNGILNNTNMNWAQQQSSSSGLVDSAVPQPFYQSQQVNQYLQSMGLVIPSPIGNMNAAAAQQFAAAQQKSETSPQMRQQQQMSTTAQLGTHQKLGSQHQSSSQQISGSSQTQKALSSLSQQQQNSWIQSQQTLQQALYPSQQLQIFQEQQQSRHQQ